MAKTFSVQQRVTVIDTVSPDHAKVGVVEADDAVTQTCTVLINGDAKAKTFRHDQITDTTAQVGTAPL